MREKSITELLAEHGISHSRDDKTTNDYRHTLRDRNGKIIGRFCAHDACKLLESLHVDNPHQRG